MVEAARNDPSLAALLMITDKLPELVATQVEADQEPEDRQGHGLGLRRRGEDGTPSDGPVSRRPSQVAPPLQNLFEMAGMNLPEILRLRDRPAEDTGGPPQTGSPLAVNESARSPTGNRRSCEG